MADILSEKTKSIVRATLPALEAHGTLITAAMYKRLFENQNVRELFNQSHQGVEGSQTKALAQAIIAYARNIDNLAALGPAVERIAQKHVGLSIRPDHYPYVATALLGAIKEVLGDAASEEILAAWGEAYWFLADILIGREEQIYDQLHNAEGGWSGLRPFKVVEKQPESDIITSFQLKPMDGGPVMRHKPGQYLTILVDVPGRSRQKRNYSISSAPNDATYRISVKREKDGVVSNYLHDFITEGSVVPVAPPTGDFYLHEQSDRPIVLLSGGVGLTPMVSMLESIVDSGFDRPVYYVHGAQDGRVHAMGTHVRNLSRNRPHLRTSIFYDNPHERDEKGVHFDHRGFISIDWLSANTPMADADFYLCGPRPFLAAFVNGLAKAGVPRDRIHFEFFGPASDLAAA